MGQQEMGKKRTSYFRLLQNPVLFLARTSFHPLPDVVNFVPRAHGFKHFLAARFGRYEAVCTRVWVPVGGFSRQRATFPSINNNTSLAGFINLPFLMANIG